MKNQAQMVREHARGWRELDGSHSGLSAALTAAADALERVAAAGVTRERREQIAQQLRDRQLTITRPDAWWEHADTLHVAASRMDRAAEALAADPRKYEERFDHCTHCGTISKQTICPKCGRERDSGILPLDSPLRNAADPAPPVSDQHPALPTADGGGVRHFAPSDHGWNADLAKSCAETLRDPHVSGPSLVGMDNDRARMISRLMDDAADLLDAARVWCERPKDEHEQQPKD